MMEEKARIPWNFILLILAQVSVVQVLGQVTELRDVQFSQDYNKNEMPPSHDGKPLKVSRFYQLSQLLLSFVIQSSNIASLTSNSCYYTMLHALI